ncbi:MAG: endonuclease [Bacilli bacterium]|nr:endonuclease [Bacilli bacterium]
MNKKIVRVSLSFASAALLFSAFSLANIPSYSVDASSYTVSSVPTTIDLNDSTESDIRSYYSSLNSLSQNERQGTNLLKNLKPILKNGQKYFSYGSSATKAVWQSYEIIDRDWEKSPASAISGYNASTNIITGYKYGSSNSSVGTNPYIHALYVNRGVDNETKAWGNHQQDQWGINQEHIWPKSCGFDDDSKGVGARGDLMHLWAGNGRVNGINHNNYFYGYVDKNKSYDDAGSYASTLTGNLKGKSKTKGGTYTVFEPQDCDKGDIARACFYMVARYNYLSGSDADGIDAGNPNLEIVNELNWGPGSAYTSSATTKGQMGILQDLLEWNRIDPPDAWEIHRNNLLYKNFTNNRNPFIDYPEWAEFIWGKSEDGSYSSTVTGYANPSNDLINVFNDGDVPPSPDSSTTEVSSSSSTSEAPVTSSDTPTSSEVPPSSQSTPTSESGEQEQSFFEQHKLLIIIGVIVLVVAIVVILSIAGYRIKVSKRGKVKIKKKRK